MIWLIFLEGGIYSICLLGLGFLAGWNIWGKVKGENTSTSPQTKNGKSYLTESLNEKSVSSGAIKSITPLERSLEDSKQIREKIEELLR